ncbi:hypothetical protein VU04_07460 [Desulfobulbus sp. TB]|nr:hypothetical protein [Desulfobulbus sp. TB]
MANQNKTAAFSLTLFNIYRKDPEIPLPDAPPSFAYTKNGETRCILFLHPEEQGNKSMRNALHRLYPLAEKTFATRKIFRTVHPHLLNELKEKWKISHNSLSVRFRRAGAFLFEEEYLLVYLEISPDMTETDSNRLAEAAVEITNIFSGRRNKRNRTEFIRIFKNDQYRDSAQERFQGNKDLPLIQGILGTALNPEDMFDTLAGPGWTSMLCDRFLLKSLLVTPTEEADSTYSDAEQGNLIRLARGMNMNYLPPPLEALSGHVIPVQTFANVLFMAANEGIAGHIKPEPGQEFLRNQFMERYRTGYTLLFVLAVYQHYRLVDLSRKLAEQTENPDEHARIKELQKIRRDLALHDLKYIITQPVFLTNSQQYYNGLRQGLNTDALVEKLRYSVTELDTLLADAEEQEKKKQKEQHEKGKMILAMTAEGTALPYYLYNVVKYLLYDFFYLKNSLLTWAVTFLVTGAVMYFTWQAMHGKKVRKRTVRNCS